MSKPKLALGEVWINRNSQGEWARWEIVGEPEQKEGSWDTTTGGWSSTTRCLAKLLDKQWDDDKIIGGIYSVLITSSWEWEEWDICGNCEGRAPEGDYLCKACRSELLGQPIASAS